jgi:hypothetical protein
MEKTIATQLQPEIFDFTIDGRDYTVEFTRDAIKEADHLGAVSDDKMGLYDRTAIILYAGLKKHHPFITLSQVQRKDGLLDQALADGYDLGSFSDIVDEFTKWCQASFTDRGGKKIVSRRKTMAAKEK